MQHVLRNAMCKTHYVHELINLVLIFNQILANYALHTHS